MNKDSIITGHLASRQVYIDGIELTPTKSFKHRNHSPDGFCWGYGGSGPSQLALALLLEATDEYIALNNYQQFKRDVIANLPENFTLNSDIIYKWLEEHNESTSTFNSI